MMRMNAAFISLILVAGCKTASDNPNLATLANANDRTFSERMATYTGEYQFNGPESAIASQFRQSESATAQGTIQHQQDGRVILSVNFHRAARAGGFIVPGTTLVMIPDGKTRTETNKVGASGFFGGSSTIEKKIETTDNQRFDAAKNQLTLTSRTLMHSRPYSWFSEKPWKLFKTVDVTLKLSGTEIDYVEIIDVGVGKEEWSMRFSRRPRNLSPNH